MKKESRTKRNDKSGMYPLVEKWESSRQSKASFCDAHGLSVDAFRYWYKKYKAEQGDATGSFVAMEVCDQAVPNPLGGIEVKYPNGVIIQLKEAVGPQYLSQLIKLGG